MRRFVLPSLLLVALSALAFVLWPDTPSAPLRMAVTLTSAITHAVEPGETLGCESLTLSPTEVQTYFATATEVEPSAFHAEAIELPCSFGGTLTLNGKAYDWRIYAAGAGYLASTDGQEQRHFLCQAACEQVLPTLMGL